MKLTIDGRLVEAGPGTAIPQAGIDLPVLCYFKHIIPQGPPNVFPVNEAMTREDVWREIPSGWVVPYERVSPAVGGALTEITRGTLEGEGRAGFVLGELARRLGAPWSYSGPADVFDEMASGSGAFSARAGGGARSPHTALLCGRGLHGFPLRRGRSEPADGGRSRPSRQDPGTQGRRADPGVNPVEVRHAPCPSSGKH